MATINEIKQQAEAVKNATQVGENTAMRVGGALAGLADIAEQQDSKLSEISNFKGELQSPIAKKSGQYITNGEYRENSAFEVVIYKIKKNTPYYLHIKLIGGNDVGYYCDADGSNPHDILGTYGGDASQVKYFDGDIKSDTDTYICLNSVLEDGYYCDVNSSITLKEKINNIDNEISNINSEISNIDSEISNIDSEISNFKGELQSPIARKTGQYITNGEYRENSAFEVVIYKIKKNTPYYLHIKLIGGNDVGYYCDADGSNPHDILGTYGGDASQVKYFDGDIKSDTDTYICLNSVLEDGYYCDVNSSITLKEKINNIDNEISNINSEISNIDSEISNIDSEISNFKGELQSPIARKTGQYITNGEYRENSAFEVVIYKIKKNTPYYLHIKLIGGNDVGYYCDADGSNPHDILGTYGGDASQVKYFDGDIKSDTDTYICLNSVLEDGYYCDVNSSITLKEKINNIDNEISNINSEISNIDSEISNIDSEISNFKGELQSPIARKTGQYITNGEYRENSAFEVVIYKIKKNTPYYLHIKLIGGNDVGYYCDADGSNPHDILGTYGGDASQVKYFDGDIKSDTDTYICLNSVLEDGYYCDVNSSITLKEKINNIDNEISNINSEISNIDSEISNIDSEISNFKGELQSPIARKTGQYITNGEYRENSAFEVVIYKIKKNTPYYLHIKLIGGNDVGYYCDADGSNPHDILGTYGGDASQVKYFDGDIKSDTDTYICLNSVLEDGYYCDMNSSITLKEKINNIDNEISNLKGSDDDVRIYCIGDSLTQGQGGENSYPPKLANLSGKTVINYGSGGDRTFEIGARIGCIPFECSPFTIPSSGSVQIAISTTDSMSQKWMGNFAPGRQNNNSFLNPYVIKGIKGNISHVGDMSASSSNHQYYFTRISDGTEKRVDFPTMVFPETPISNKHIKVIWSGTNDGSNMFEYEGGVEHVVKEIKLLVDTTEKYIVVGCHDCNSSFSYDQLMAFNTKLKDTFGNHYVDIYDFIIKYGLAYEGLTATQQDNTDIANNIVPTSLRFDGIHFNSYGYDIVANLIYDRLCALGYL